jgi:hypothetical protein
MSGQLSFRCSASELEAAHRAHLREISRVRLVVLVFFGVSVGILISWMDGFRSLNTTLTYVAIMLAWLLVVMTVIIVGFRWFWLKRFSNRIYHQQSEFRGDIHVMWDDAGFKTETDSGTFNARWGDFHAWKRTDTMLLLYRSEVMYNFIPLGDPDTVKAADDIVAALIANGIEARKK